MKTVFTFLGRGEKRNGGYRTACYRFGPDSARTVAFFGMALAEWVKPERLVILGTAGSIWDVLLLENAAGGLSDDLLEEVCSAVVAGSVTQELLERLAPLLRSLCGHEVELVLIPYAREEAGQLEILASLTRLIAPGDEIVMDVTHGFRHLPILALVAARFLQRVRQARISALYYGALEMTDGVTNETPVLELSGLLGMLDWIDAFSAYDHGGDYSVFAPVIENGGGPEALSRALRQAAHCEYTSNPVGARQWLQPLLGKESPLASLSGPGRLFAEELRNRFAWTRKNDRHLWQLSLADGCLARGDWMRACLYLYESLASRIASEENIDLNDFDARKAAFKARRTANADIRKLDRLRNCLAHGLPPNDSYVMSAVRTPESLAAELRRLRAALF